MVEKPVIKRYLDPDIFEGVKTDFKRLVKIINNSGGEYSLQLRENYFNIYYQGNSLAKVMPHGNGKYIAEIHKKFVQGNILAKLKELSTNKPYSRAVNTSTKSSRIRFEIERHNIHRFFQKVYLTSISSNIHKINAGEEITFEQVLITDNPPSDKFIIIDRQVGDHKDRALIDLLALRRGTGEKKFHFLVIEVKLGKNYELREKVGYQLNGYVKRIRQYITDYVHCYEENYRQKWELGLFQPFESNLPSTIEIDQESKTVAGLIVVGGYSQIGKKALDDFGRTINENEWKIEIQQMRREIKTN